MKKSLKMLVAGTVIGCALTASVGAFGAAAQEVNTWSGLKTGISSEFEAGHKGTGQYGTDTSRIITQCWAACQDGANAARDIVYSPKVGTSDVGRYKASCEHWNNPFVTTSKYYGWYY